MNYSNQNNNNYDCNTEKPVPQTPVENRQNRRGATILQRQAGRNRVHFHSGVPGLRCYENLQVQELETQQLVSKTLIKKRKKNCISCRAY